MEQGQYLISFSYYNPDKGRITIGSTTQSITEKDFNDWVNFQWDFKNALGLTYDTKEFCIIAISKLGF